MTIDLGEWGSDWVVMPIFTISLTFGHTEDATLSSLTFMSGRGFEIPMDALSSLAIHLWAQYEREQGPRQCCRKDLKANFCSVCGSRINKEPDFETWRDWLRQLVCQTTDSFGAIDWPEEEWNPWIGLEELLKLPAATVLNLEEMAEDYLILALPNRVEDYPWESALLTQELLDSRWPYHHPPASQWADVPELIGELRLE